MINIDNNFVEVFHKFIILFADDTLLLAGEYGELQVMLNQLSFYCKKWQMNLNVNKTEVMIFKSPIRPKYCMRDRLQKMFVNL